LRVGALAESLVVELDGEPVELLPNVLDALLFLLTVQAVIGSLG
jgi:hypothetical protein